MVVLSGRGDTVVYASEEDQAARPISTARLNVLPRLHLPPIHAVVSCGPSGTNGTGDLILGGASHLDAFSGYPFPT